MPSKDKTSLPAKDKQVHKPEDILVTGGDSFDRIRAERQTDYIVVFDPAGKIHYVNPAFAGAMGYTAERMAGTLLLTYVAEEFRETMKANMAALKKADDPPFYETALRAKNGLTRSVIVKGRPVIYNNNPAILVFFIDMTERKALEDLLAARAEELFQISTAYKMANKKLTLLSSITRHDINNQLTVLKGYLGMLETEQPDQELTDYCRKATSAAERIAAMIRFTSEYEKIGITAPAWIECREIVDTAAKDASFGHVILKNDLPSGFEIYADPLIIKVFYNLMDNAVRYGGKISTIRFSVEENAGKSIIVCDDDGEGVTDNEKEQIFDRGFGKNTGLGLALSREILDITGITIRENGTPGAGARFEMTVPEESYRYTHTS